MGHTGGNWSLICKELGLQKNRTVAEKKRLSNYAVSFEFYIDISTVPLQNAFRRQIDRRETGITTLRAETNRLLEGTLPK